MVGIDIRLNYLIDIYKHEPGAPLHITIPVDIPARRSNPTMTGSGTRRECTDGLQPAGILT